MSVKTQNELALASVKAIYDAANEAQAEAERAHSAADNAATAASDAQTSADNAATAASDAQTQANAAMRYANSALDQLGIVEDVIGVLTWASEHGTFTATTDTTVQDGKVYFTYDSTTQDYVPVVTPADNPRTAGYYELTVDEAMETYIMSHLAVTSRGLWVLPNGIGSASSEQYASGYKVLLSSDGMYVYDGSGALVSTFGESITFSATRAQYIGNNNAYIVFDPTGSGSLTIGGATINISGRTLDQVLADKADSSDIPTKTSDLTNDSGYATTSDIPTKTSDLTNDSGYATTSDIPTSTSDLTNDSGYITSSALPTNVSDLTNDSGYLTVETIQGALDEKVDSTFLYQYLRYDSTLGLMLANGIDDSSTSIKAVLRSDRLSFYQGDTEVAYISNNQLYVTQSVVLQQMDLGRRYDEVDPVTGETGLGQWSWKVHANANGRNNLNLKWIG